MFSSHGLFKDVPCPGGHDCNLPNCLFRHDDTPSITDGDSGPHQVYDPTSILPSGMNDSPPPAKRRKLAISYTPIGREAGARDETVGFGNTHSSGSVVHPPSSRQKETYFASHSVPTPGVNGVNKGTKAFPTSNAASLSPRTNDPRLSATTPASMTRPVSPPPISKTQKKTSSPAKPYRKPVNTRNLTPRSVEQNPISFGVRQAMLKKIHKQIEDANERCRKEFSEDSNLILSVDELQTQAEDDEERIANQNPNPDTYRIALGHRAAFFTAKKMSPTIWKDFITTTWLTDPNAAITVPSKDLPPPEIKSGLSSKAQETTILKLLRTGLHQYAQYGYVIKAPTDKQVYDAKRAHQAAGNFETCDRCATRFHVYQGRSLETGALTSKGSCSYHWARLPMYRGATKDGAVFPCCGQSPGSAGCEKAPTHAFKVSDPARLESLLPFKETPKHNDGKSRGPIVFDCEMSYTTCGLELIRVTALSWPDNTTKLDVLVRPIGEILDFNTRFSGVTPTMFTDAPDYGHCPRPKYTAGEKLQKVASPAAARDLLFDLLDPDTPLLGHAIDNDLNSCRIIHPFVIDTVLLYPHPRGLPIRYKLRDLARIHLQRKIQQGESVVDGGAGHDSKEDSAATGDLVLKKVGDKWAVMEREGWWWRDDALMTPGSAKGRKEGNL